MASIHLDRLFLPSPPVFDDFIPLRMEEVLVRINPSSKTLLLDRTTMLGRFVFDVFCSLGSGSLSLSGIVW